MPSVFTMNVIMLSVVVLNVIMLNVIMPSVAMLNVIMLGVVAPGLDKNVSNPRPSRCKVGQMSFEHMSGRTNVTQPFI